MSCIHGRIDTPPGGCAFCADRRAEALRAAVACIEPGQTTIAGVTNLADRLLDWTLTPIEPS